MAKKVVFIGSIGVLAETSNIQRQAYNEAFAHAEVSWRWDIDTYKALLSFSGGKNRLQLLSDATSANLTQQQIDDIHTRKTNIAVDRIRTDGIDLRPGVTALINFCNKNGIDVGLVTSTYMPNIEALEVGARAELPLDKFAVVVSRENIENGKPAPDAYERALAITGFEPGNALAIEDTAISALAARRAGIDTLLTPGDFTVEQPYLAYENVIESLADDQGELDLKIRNIILE
ncbi:MAG: HAD-IA family hydrolase [Pseudomonadota bacterium]